MAKYDRNFNFQFASALELPQNNAVEPLEITLFMQTDLADNILVTGQFVGQLNAAGQTLSATAGGPDIYLAKYEPDGTPVFARRYGGSSPEEARDVTSDQDGNLYLVGNFQGTLDLDGSITDDDLSSTGDHDGFLAKLSASGDFINVQPVRSGGEVLLKHLSRHPTTPQTLVMDGIFEQRVELAADVSLTSLGGFDLFFARYDLTQPPLAREPVVLATLSEYEGLPGTQVTLRGENFATTLAENVVRFGDTEASLVSVSEAGTELIVTVPTTLVAGEYTVSVTAAGTSDEADQVFTVLEETAVTLASLSASEGRPGDQVVLMGTGFTAEATVNFGAVAVAATDVNDEGTILTLVVPEQVPGDYDVSVTVEAETTASQPFRINEPQVVDLRSLSVYVGRVGDEVVLRGENFGPTAEDNVVTLGEAVAEVVSVNETNTELTIRVPDVAVGSYPVSVSIGDQTDTDDRAFLVDTYCASSSQEDLGIRIERVRLDQTDYVAEAECVAYTSFTERPTELVIARSAALNVTVGTCAEDEDKAVRVFADWNDDQDFNDEGEVVATSPPLAGSATFETEISVPPGIPNGLATRLRIVLSSVSESRRPGSVSACGTYANGETQDYRIQLVASPPPRITGLSPAVLEADQESTLVISGENFGDVPDGITVVLGDAPVDAASVRVNEAGTQVTVSTPPLAVGEYEVRVAVGGQTAVAPGELSVTSEPVLDQAPPRITLSAPTVLSKEEATLTVSGEVSDASGVSGVTVELLPIRQNPLSSNWRSINVARQGTTNTYVAQLIDTDLDGLGVQTRMIASDELGNSDTSDVQYTFRQYTVAEPLTLRRLAAAGADPSANDYNLLAIPLQDQSVDRVFGALGNYDTQRWRAWQLSGSGTQNAPYQEFSRGWTGELRAGQGYMLIYTEATNFQTTGRVVEATYDTPFTITLQPGFNLIGNPYPFALDWPAVLAYNRKDDGSLTLKTFNQGFQEATRLEAYQGALVVNPNEGQPVTLALPVGTVVATPGGRSGQENSRDPSLEEAWQLSFTLNAGAFSRRASIGMHPAATVGYDRYDDFTPPRLTGFLELNSVHPDFFLPKFSQDIVPTAAQYQWTWTVATHEPNRAVTLRWNPEAVKDLSQTLRLVDERGVRALDMSEQGSYSFWVDEAGTYDLQVTYGEADARAGEAESPRVGRAYPNPAAGQFHLPVRVLTGESLVLEVFDATGRQVGKQHYGGLSPGYQTLIWQRTSADRPTPAGLHLYRLHSTSTHRTVSGRVLLR